MTAGPVGSIKLVKSNYHLTEQLDLINVRSEVLALGASDPRQRYQVAFQGGKGNTQKEDDKLLIYVKADAQGTVDATSTILLPVTFKDLSNGHEWDSFLTAADFGLDSTDIVCAAGAWTLVGTYTVPAQTAVKIGHKNPMNSLAYIVLAYT